MRQVIKTFLTLTLSLSIYKSCINPTSASVSRDDDDQIAGIAGAGSNKPSIVQPSAPSLIIQDAPKTFTLSPNLTVDSESLKLKDIDEIREYFKKGFLEIKPDTYPDLANCAAPYKMAFKAYDKGLSLKGWNDQNDLKGLSKLLSYFNAVKEIKCRKNIWQEKTIINTLGNAIQYYEKLEALDLKDMNLNDKGILKLLKVLPNPDSLKLLNMQASKLSPEAQSEIKKKYFNLSEFIIGTETKTHLPNTEPKAVKETPAPLDGLKIENTDEQKALSLKPLYTPPIEKQKPVVKNATLQTNDPNNNAEEKAKTLTLTRPSKKLRDSDILSAIYNVKEKTLSIKDFAAFVNSDPTYTKIMLCNRNIGDEGAKAIAEALSQNTTLTMVYLGNSIIGDEGAKAIADALKLNKTLRKVKLWGNKIGDEGANAIAAALHENKILTTIILKDNKIGDEGAKTFADALKQNTTLTMIDLHNTDIGTEGAKAIAGALSQNTTLTTVSLSANSIGDEGAKAIATAIEENKTLTSLNLASNNIGDAGKKDLEDLKRSRPALKINY